MGTARQARRKAKKYDYFNVLSQHLSEFYEFLESKPQPSNEAVVERFNKHNKEWIQFCSLLQLSGSDLFVINIKKMWERKSEQVQE